MNVFIATKLDQEGVPEEIAIAMQGGPHWKTRDVFAGLCCIDAVASEGANIFAFDGDEAKRELSLLAVRAGSDNGTVGVPPVNSIMRRVIRHCDIPSASVPLSVASDWLGMAPFPEAGVDTLADVRCAMEVHRAYLKSKREAFDVDEDDYNIVDANPLA